MDIKELCKAYTYLKDEDIGIIEHISNTLQFISDLVKSDVFIDCPTKESGKAIVVAQAKPCYCKSLYSKNVVGQLALRENEPAVIRTMEIGMPTKDVKGITQENINTKQTVEPIKNKTGKTVGALIIEKDEKEIIDASRRIEILAETNETLTNILTEKTVKKEQKKYISHEDNNITYHIDDAIIIFDENGIVRFKNPVADKLYRELGYKENLIGMDFNNISLSDHKFSELIENKQVSSYEVSINDMVLQVKYVFQNNKNFNLAMLIKDITYVKEQEKELILKSVVIKEIHHRVKNNLQTVASLLRLQARRIDNEEFKSALNESMNRILSIAATHEILAREGIDELNIKDVIQRIKYSMFRDCYIEDVQIELIVTGDDFSINSQTSTSVSLIINELIQNSIKHAFKHKDKGKIEVNIHKGNKYSTISVIDNGNGFDINSVKDTSLGLSIVRQLVTDKLHGELNLFSNEQGTKAVFDFKN